MANTCSQISIQVVFAVQGRPNVIPKQNKEELHKYMTGSVPERDQKLLVVHCMPDHTHMPFRSHFQGLVGLVKARGL
jgi:REP element-mobilizing transposase RayT